MSVRFATFAPAVLAGVLALSGTIPSRASDPPARAEHARAPAKTRPAETSPERPGPAETAPAAPDRHALLVGIEAYFREQSGWPRLTGPHADVEALSTALVERGGFAPENIRRLFDHEATRVGILDAFRDLVDAAAPGDLLLFYYSGHGSQIADDSGDEAADGLDETLVPFDAVLPSGMRNDLRDDEIEDLIALANRKTDRVVLIFDCCNSGTVHRATSNVVERFVPPQDRGRGLAGKREDREKSAPAALALRGATRRESLEFPANLRYVTLGACRSHQTAAEIEVPADGGRTHGVFTYCLVQQLYDMQPGWSYADLMDRVRAEVRQLRPSQSPVIQGALASEALFADGAVATEPYFVLVEHGDRLELRAGSIHGVRTGDLFYVGPENAARDDPEARAGTVRVERAGTVVSRASWVERQAPAAKDERRRYRVFEAARAPGVRRVRVAIHDTPAIAGPVRERIEREIRDARDLALAEGPGEADYVIRELPPPVDRGAEPAARALRLEVATPTGAALPIRTRTAADVTLFVERLEALGRRHRILAIHNETSRTLCARASIVRLTDRNEVIGPVPRDPHTGIPTLELGERFACEIENCSDLPVYATLLVISPDGMIQDVWSTAEDEPILPRQIKRTIPLVAFIPPGADAFYENADEVFRIFVSREPHDLSHFRQRAVPEITLSRSFELEPDGVHTGQETIDDSWLTVTMQVRTRPE